MIVTCFKIGEIRKAKHERQTTYCYDKTTNSAKHYPILIKRSIIIVKTTRVMEIIYFYCYYNTKEIIKLKAFLKFFKVK